MDSQDAQQHPANDDQELAKILDSGGQDTPKDDAQAAGGLQFDQSLPQPADPAASPADDDQDEVALDEAVRAIESSAPQEAAAARDTPAPAHPAAHAAGHGALDEIRKDALEELRPLVDRLDLPADEKFDTMLLIIRSTDDQSLLAPAHAAAKAIEDETKRAQALLDIIKEIDYFSNQGQQAA